MLKKTHTLIEIIVVIIIIGILAMFALPSFFKPTLNAAQKYAQTVLKSISLGAETYSSANNGDYPTDARADLYTNADPKYFNEDFLDGQVRQGYIFSCTSTTSGYTCSATPQGVYASQADTYTITTGGTLTSTPPGS